jgi:hypothetical protein
MPGWSSQIKKFWWCAKKRAPFRRIKPRPGNLNLASAKKNLLRRFSAAFGVFRFSLREKKFSPPFSRCLRRFWIFTTRKKLFPGVFSPSSAFLGFHRAKKTFPRRFPAVFGVFGFSPHEKNFSPAKKTFFRRLKDKILHIFLKTTVPA